MDVEDFQQDLLLWSHILGVETFTDFLAWYEKELA
jgi:hypothetical protein